MTKKYKNVIDKKWLHHWILKKYRPSHWLVEETMKQYFIINTTFYWVMIWLIGGDECSVNRAAMVNLFFSPTYLHLHSSTIICGYTTYSMLCPFGITSVRELYFVGTQQGPLGAFKNWISLLISESFFALAMIFAWLFAKWLLMDTVECEQEPLHCLAL